METSSSSSSSPPSSSAAMDGNSGTCNDITTIQKNMHVLVSLVHDPKQVKAIQLKPKQKIRVGKLSFKLEGAVGYPFGSVFEVDKKGNLKHKVPTADLDDELVSDGNVERGHDNRNLVDDTAHQKLTASEIFDLKQSEDKSREDVIKQIAANSETFKSKTEFSQQKYLRRKKKLHLKDVIIQQPKLRNVMDLYMQHFSEKICNMRDDTLSMLLHRINVRASGKYLLFETCAGLIASGMALRMNGHGELMQLHSGNQPPRKITSLLNMSQVEEAVFRSFPLEEVADLDEARRALKASVGVIQSQEDTPARARRLHTKELKEASLASLEAGGYDGLVIASRFRPLPILEALFNFLSPSRPIVIYSAYKEQLLECMPTLRGRAVHIHVASSVMRDYQVLPQRTHPENMTTCTPGYLLTATTLATPMTIRHLTPPNEAAEGATKTSHAVEAEADADADSLDGGNVAKKPKMATGSGEP